MPESLWDFAVRCYRAPEIAEQCQLLQERADADINLLLTAAWLTARGERWQAEDTASITALCAAWRTHTVLPLRAVRRYLKQQSEHNEMYRAAKALELQAEAEQLRRIETAAPTLPLIHLPITASLLKMNLRAYADAMGKIDIHELDVLARHLGTFLDLEQ